MTQIQRHTKQNKVVKPFCKVCFDAGKPEAEYISHFVKSEPGIKGVVVCPTLLSQACTYCHKNGHTVKFCQVLSHNQKKYTKEEKRQNYYRNQNDDTGSKIMHKMSLKNNLFDVLDLDDEGTGDSEESNDNQFTSLRKTPSDSYNHQSNHGSTTPPYPPPSYATIAAKPKCVIKLQLPDEGETNSPYTQPVSGCIAPRDYNESVWTSDDEDNYPNYTEQTYDRNMKWSEYPSSDEE